MKLLLEECTRTNPYFIPISLFVCLQDESRHHMRYECGEDIRLIFPQVELSGIIR